MAIGVLPNTSSVNCTTALASPVAAASTTTRRTITLDSTTTTGTATAVTTATVTTTTTLTTMAATNIAKSAALTTTTRPTTTVALVGATIATNPTIVTKAIPSTSTSTAHLLTVPVAAASLPVATSQLPAIPVITTTPLATIAAHTRSSSGGSSTTADAIAAPSVRTAVASTATSGAATKTSGTTTRITFITATMAGTPSINTTTVTLARATNPTTTGTTTTAAATTTTTTRINATAITTIIANAASSKSEPSSNGPVVLRMTLRNVDYALLSANYTLLSVFIEAVGEAIASAAGKGIGREDVQLTLSPGSVIVQATITPPRGVPASSVQSELLSSASLGEAITDELTGLGALGAVSTGAVGVGSVSVRGAPPAAAEQSATQAAAEAAPAAAATSTAPATCSHLVGSPGLGVACQEGNSGEGFLLYSAQSVHARFPSWPPHENNADHFLCVRHHAGMWQYDTNQAWQDFLPAPGDVLVAAVDFHADAVASLAGRQEVLHGIAKGYAVGDLEFDANRWAGAYDSGKFAVAGTFFSRACRPEEATFGSLNPLDVVWITSPWSPCSAGCGLGKRSRLVACSLGHMAMATCNRTGSRPVESEACQDRSTCQSSQSCFAGVGKGCQSWPLTLAGVVMLAFTCLSCCILACYLHCTRRSVLAKWKADEVGILHNPSRVVQPLDGKQHDESGLPTHQHAGPVGSGGACPSLEHLSVPEPLDVGRASADAYINVWLGNGVRCTDTLVLEPERVCTGELQLESEEHEHWVREPTRSAGDIIYTPELAREFMLLENAIEPETPALERTSQSGDVLYALHAAHSAVPQLLQLVSPNGQSACQGEYLLMDDDVANGQPLWRQHGGNLWLYSSCTGKWCVGGSDVWKRGFAASAGYICHRRPHRGTMPDRVSSAWSRWDGQGFQDDAAIAITALARSAVEAPPGPGQSQQPPQESMPPAPRPGVAGACGSTDVAGALLEPNPCAEAAESSQPENELEMGPMVDACLPSHWTIPHIPSDLSPIRPNEIPGIETWLTAGARHLMKSRGSFYHEVKLGHFPTDHCMQLGWLTDDFKEGPVDGTGVGDDDSGWAADGLRHKKWHGKAEHAAWSRDWCVGDIIGLAIDIKAGCMRFSLNGEWEGNADMSFEARGRAFFPAVSMKGLFIMHIPQSTWVFRPPTDGHRPWSDRGVFTRPMRVQDGGVMYCVFPSGSNKTANFSV